jgi:hypothetical protein
VEVARSLHRMPLAEPASDEETNKPHYFVEVAGVNSLEPHQLLTFLKPI